MFVNLGLRLRLRDGFLDCPPSKRRILLRDLRAWVLSAQEAGPPRVESCPRPATVELDKLDGVFPSWATVSARGWARPSCGRCWCCC